MSTVKSQNIVRHVVVIHREIFKNLLFVKKRRYPHCHANILPGNVRPSVLQKMIESKLLAHLRLYVIGTRTYLDAVTKFVSGFEFRNVDIFRFSNSRNQSFFWHAVFGYFQSRFYHTTQKPLEFVAVVSKLFLVAQVSIQQRIYVTSRIFLLHNLVKLSELVHFLNRRFHVRNVLVASPAWNNQRLLAW